ncbi:hypothetical protein E1265_19410 [Streptomyces sp. 8K308]|uniref:hypothetical protein n=1 Tax=Streptomyces sp. 8K308 TaxID=2530388 RepID=UPI00104B6F73|nr:hypothetical protein [Streptomyces sp. 8K308]TDC20967.1 hypothetical protein E1265_19410 [Streptomyces sp. 8K308]
MADRSTRARSGPRRLARWRSRVAVGAALVALTTTLTVGTSSPAQADEGYCPSGLTWSYFYNGSFTPEYVAGEYVINSVRPDFLVSEERVVVNGTNREITGSFTSSVSRTFSLTVTAGTSASLFGFLSANVSASITQSTTTTTGVTATTPVPPYGRVIGQYGVEAYAVDYTIREYRSIGALPEDGGLCYLHGSTAGTSVAPTVYTGWRVIPG